MIGGVHGAMILLGEADRGPFTPVAFWPDPSREMQHLVPVVEKALAERRGVLTAEQSSPVSAKPSNHIAYPVEISGKLHGVVALEVTERSEEQLQEALRQIHWGGAWLEIMVLRQMADKHDGRLQRMKSVLDLVATAVQTGDFPHVSMSLTNDLATKFACDRVSLGWVKKGFVTLLTISNMARFDGRTSFVQSLEAVMEEALDQQHAVVFPQAGSVVVANRLHEELVQKSDTTSVCTVLLPGRDEVFGALTLERTSSRPFDADEIELCTAAAHLLGPVLESHWQNEHWFGARLGDKVRQQLATLFGPRHIALKTVATLLFAAVVFMSLMKVEYRVSAKTVIEGAVQRAISAPFDGFLTSASVRAGDLVRSGQTLCLLDDKDLLLEKSRWLSEGEQSRRRFREALASHERAALMIAQAQTHQSEAEVALLDEKLRRAKITAPFNGVVVSGDLSQKLGSPLRQGEELFKLAPLEQYRVILQVDEREIANITVGKKGALILSGLTSDTFPFVVKTITPVSVAEGGRNYFRVEAALEHTSSLRPGMEGIGKIESGPRSLLWIWTHGITDWFRLWVWSWWL
jgi:biotin carboxyl carrier protein